MLWLPTVAPSGHRGADRPPTSQPFTFRPPLDPDAVTHAMTIPVPDCRAAHETLRSRGAEFLTATVGLEWEVRCILRDPDGHLIELSEARTSSAS
jgi:hypothetical protein